MTFNAEPKNKTFAFEGKSIPGTGNHPLPRPQVGNEFKFILNFQTLPPRPPPAVSPALPNPKQLHLGLHADLLSQLSAQSEAETTSPGAVSRHVLAE